MRQLLPVAVLVALVAGFAAPAAAGAGSYSVSACSSNDSYRLPNRTWQPFNDLPSRLQLTSSCPASSGYGSLGVRFLPGAAGTMPAGAGAGWIFTPPAGLKVVGAGYDMYAGAFKMNGWYVGGRRWGQPSAGCLTDASEWQCFYGWRQLPAAPNVSPVTADPQPLPLPASDGRPRVGITCEPPPGYSGCTLPSTVHEANELAVYGASVQLTEEVPTTPEVTASIVGATDGWIRSSGSAPVRIFAQARDFTGIARIEAYARGAGQKWADGDCFYADAIPCSNLSTSLNWFWFPDGRYTIEVSATDPTGMTGEAEPMAINVDSTAPAAPTAIASSVGESWQTSATATVTWRLPVEFGDVAPLTAASYQLCDDDFCLPPQTADSMTSTAVTVPAEGAWRVDVWLTDAAGNVSQARSATTIRYAAQAPAPPSQLRREPAGAWQREPTVRLTWDLPTGDGAPVTKAWVRRCAVGGDCDAPLVAATTTSATVALPGDGAHRLEVWLENAAGLARSDDSATVIARLDTVSPPAPAGLLVTAANGGPDALVSWAQPDSVGAPFDHSRWRLCRAAGGTCVAEGRTTSRTLSVRVPATGDWRLSVVHVDVVGNESDAAETSWTYAPPLPDPPIVPLPDPQVPPLVAPPAPSPGAGAGTQPPAGMDGGGAAAPRPVAAALKLRIARAPHRSLRIAVTAARSLTARARLTIRVTGGRTSRTLLRDGVLRDGRLVLTVPLPRGARLATVRVTTPATASHRSGSASGRLRLPG